MNVKTKIMFEQGYMYVFCGTNMSRGSFQQKEQTVAYNLVSNTLCCIISI